MFHGAIDNEIGASVVNLEGRGWLGMDHIGEYGTDHGTLFGIKNAAPSSALVAEDIIILMMEKKIRKVPFTGRRM